MHKWNVYEDFKAASAACADFLADEIFAAVESRGVCYVALPGGSTPGLCLSMLTKKRLPWSSVHWYLGDERCYPQGHAERNDDMLQKCFWSHIKGAVVHRIPAELGAELAAGVYSKDVDLIGRFDIVFLGIGEDGHTASLFPGNAALQDSRSVVPVYKSPKAPDERVSLSVETLRNSRCRIILAGGEGKADIIGRVRNDEALPVNCVGDISWYVDEAAYS